MQPSDVDFTGMGYPWWSQPGEDELEQLIPFADDLDLLHPSDAQSVEASALPGEGTLPDLEQADTAPPPTVQDSVSQWKHCVRVRRESRKAERREADLAAFKKYTAEDIEFLLQAKVIQSCFREPNTTSGFEVDAGIDRAQSRLPQRLNDLRDLSIRVLVPNMSSRTHHEGITQMTVAHLLDDAEQR
eukprot:scaffold1085_cov407-Prasinococcus_capsulatus_cf.AAC.73